MPLIVCQPSGEDPGQAQGTASFFSICIPHHNRAEFLIQVLHSIDGQTFRDVEVCIADDASTDDSNDRIAQFAATSLLPVRYYRQKSNVRYDANLRSAIAIARGKYCFLLGNDDALKGGTALEQLARELKASQAAAAITNFEDYESGRLIRRVTAAGAAGSGPDLAVRQYRNFSFVSGVILDRRLAQTYATSDWDGSEMYQMFLACRIISAGGSLLLVDLPAIRKDITVPGQIVDRYSLRPRLKRKTIRAEVLPLMQIPRLVFSAVAPDGSEESNRRLAFRIVAQLYSFTLPYWVVEYRRSQSFAYAAGVAIGASLGRIGAGLPLNGVQASTLRFIHTAFSVAALTIPFGAFRRCERLLHRIAKRTTAVRLGVTAASTHSR